MATMSAIENAGRPFRRKAMNRNTEPLPTRGCVQKNIKQRGNTAEFLLTLKVENVVTRKGFLAELPCQSVPTIQLVSGANRVFLTSSRLVTSFAREKGAWHRYSI